MQATGLRVALGCPGQCWHAAGTTTENASGVLQELQEVLLQGYTLKCSKGGGHTEELRGRQGWFRAVPEHQGVGAAEGELPELQGRDAAGAHSDLHGKYVAAGTS